MAKGNLSHKAGFSTFIIFLLLVIFSYTDQNLISPNLNPILADFGFGENSTPLGFLTFVFTLLSAVSMVIFGVSTDKYSRKWICFGGSLLYCTFSILSYLTPLGPAGYPYLFFTRAMNGIGMGCVIPTIFSLIGDLVKPTNRSKALSAFSVAGLLGQGIGLFLAPSVYAVTGSWRLPFLIIGLVNLACTLLILFVREPARGRTEAFIADLVAGGKVYSYTIKRQDLHAILERKSNIWLVINFVDTIPTGIILFLLFRYMENVHNVSEVSTTSVLVVVLVGGILGTMVFGVLSDHYFKRGSVKVRVKFAFLGNIIPVPFLLIAFLIPFYSSTGATIGQLFAIPELVFFIFLMFCGLFFNGLVGGNWYATLIDVNLPEHRGTLVATAKFFDLLGNALGPLIGSWFDTTFGSEVGMLSSVVFWAVLPLFWIGVLKNVEKDMEFVKNTLKARGEEMARNTSKN